MFKGDLESLKAKLKTYNKEEISFNDPHFTQQLTLREGNKDEVLKNLQNPEKLVYCYAEEGKYGDTKHVLHFQMSNSRTMIIPVIFDLKNEKGLYVITYIMRHRGVYYGKS